ncbi:MAG: hypothetical protein EOP53_21680 [Sphingobacteriales bacterium]|nr:MAG: hypothetical protein EOP53_21680 [Sphingobacteriales bacterium]
MKKGLGLFFVFGMCVCNFVQAQYQPLLNPQSTQQIQKFKEQKVAAQSIFMDVNGSQAPYGLVKFDEHGRILKNITPKNHQHFTYDENGRLTSFIDSAHDGRRFWKNEYAFAFDAEGRPQNFKLGKTTSNFIYDAAKRELVEATSTAKTIYKYNEENKITEEITEGGDQPKVHKYIYNKYGDLASEILAQKNLNGTDSAKTIYTYDSKGKLLRKQVTTIQSVDDAGDPTTPPTVTKTTKVINYAYDIRTGLLISENIVCSNPKENCKTEWTYDNFGLPIKESKLDATGKPIQAFVYKYSYVRK